MSNNPDKNKECCVKCAGFVASQFFGEPEPLTKPYCKHPACRCHSNSKREKEVHIISGPNIEPMRVVIDGSTGFAAPNTNDWQSRFDKEIDYCTRSECVDRNEIKSFIASEITKAREQAAEAALTRYQQQEFNAHDEYKRGATQRQKEIISILEGLKKEYHNRQFHDNCYDCIDVTTYNTALTEAITQISKQV